MKTKALLFFLMIGVVWGTLNFFFPVQSRSVSQMREGLSTDTPPSMEFVNSLGGAMTTMTRVENIVYVGEGASLALIDFTNPANPFQISRFPLQDWVHKIVVQDGRAFIANGSGGLKIMDVQNPTHPVLLATFETGGFALELIVIEQFVYLVDVWEGVFIVDVHDPVHPILLTTLPLEQPPILIERHMDFVYLLGGGGPLVIVDVSQPSQPVIVDQYEGVTASDFKVVGQYGYFTGLVTASLLILDLANPHDIIPVSSTEWFWQSGKQIEVYEGYAYISYVDWINQESLTVVDIRDPAHPARIQTLMDLRGIAEMVVQGNALYLCQYSQLSVLDLSNPPNPVEMGHIQSFSEGGAMHIEGNIAYMNSYGGLKILDVSHPISPTLIGQFATPMENLSFRNDLAYQAGRVYLANDEHGVQIIDVSNPVSPTLVGTYTNAPAGFGRIEIEGPTAYVLNIMTLEILDLSNPLSPTLQAEYPGLRDFILDKNIVYGVDGDGVHILDVSHPGNPTLLTIYDPGIPVNCWDCLTKLNQYLYLATSYGQGLHILDVSDPAHPILVGRNPLYAFDIQVNGSYLYALSYQPNSNKTLHLLDLSIPQSPRLRSTYTLPFPFVDLQIVDDLVYIGDSVAGLQILRLHPELFPPDIYLPLLQTP